MIWIYFKSHLFSIIANKFYIKSFFITITINDASVDIGDDEDSFQFSHEAEFTSDVYVHVNFATDTEAELPYNCYSVKNMLKLLAFKWFLKKLLLETMIRGHVDLVICLN